MEPDRIGLDGGLNPYIYANGNPISNIDPSGLEFSVINENYFTTNHEKNFYDFTNFLAGFGDTLLWGSSIVS